MESGDKGKHEKQGCEGAGRQKRQDHRRSLINLETSRDEELDAILGDLTLLQGEFETEIQEDRRRKASSQATEEECHCRGATSEETGSSSGSVRQAGERRYAGVRVKSPDTDSAFCDNISLLSSCSGGNGDGRGHRFTEKEEEKEKLKNEQIKLAIEKIKEASIKKIFIKVFTTNGAATSLLVDEKMTVGQVTRILAEKNNIALDPKWALVELLPNLFMERVYEDNELLVENCLLWKVDSKNTLWFIERPEKFDLFSRPEIYLLGSCSSQKDDQMEEHSRQELLEEYFSSSGVGAPQIEGFMWLKADSKKSWKKFYFILRTSGLYYAPKGKKTSKDLVCLTTFDVNQVYYGVGWKGKYKAPSEYCFGIKHPQIQAKNPKYIKYLCVDTQKELHEWVTGIRIAKNGRHLFDNYRGIVEEITHADIDILNSKRFSIDSSRRLEKATEDALCQVLTPSSENKSLASALSSGIESDMSQLSQSSRISFPRGDVSPTDPERCAAEVGRTERGLDVSRKLSYTSQSSSTSGCISDRGFETDFPAGGTIKKRPANHVSPCSGWNINEKTNFEHKFKSEDLMPPPPISSLSLESLDSLDLLPPPPPELCTPLPTLNLASLPPSGPSRPSTLKKSNSVHKAPSSRKISFDDNVQMIEASPCPDSSTIQKFTPLAPIRNENPRKLSWGDSNTTDSKVLPRSFLENLQKVMNKKWQVAEKCQANVEMTPHKVLGFRTEEPVNKVGQPNMYSKNSAIGAWVLETQMYAHEPPFYQQEEHHQAAQKHNFHSLAEQSAPNMFQAQGEPFYHQQHLQDQHHLELLALERQHYGHDGVYQPYEMAIPAAIDQVCQAPETEGPYGYFSGCQKISEPLYVDPGRMRQNKGKRPPPPPRRSEETQLSTSHGI